MILAKDIIGCEFKEDQILPFLVEVKLEEPVNNSFLRVRETLSRIGVASAKPGEENTLYQSCHILKKRGKFYIVHFKTLFILEGRDNSLTINDIARCNMITTLLKDWKLLTIVKPEMLEGTTSSMSSIKVVQYSDRSKWILKPKYQIGKKKKEEECWKASYMASSLP